MSSVAESVYHSSAAITGTGQERVSILVRRSPAGIVYMRRRWRLRSGLCDSECKKSDTTWESEVDNIC